jgi:hypothetical protein
LLSESLLSVADDPDRLIFYCPDCSWDGLPGTLEFADVCIFPGARPPGDPTICLRPRLFCTDPVVERTCVKSDGVPMSGTSETLKVGLGEIETFFSSVVSRDRWAPLAVHPDGIRASSDANYLVAEAFGPGPRFDDCHAEWRMLSALIAPAQIGTGSLRACRDAVAHEYLHAVFDARGGLSGDSCTQSRAIEEGYGDVFAELIEAHHSGGFADWRKGTGCGDCGLIGSSSLDTPFSQPCHASRFSTCGAGLDPTSFSTPLTWSFFRERCDGDFNSPVIGKLGYLMGRSLRAGAVAHGGLDVTGIGIGAADVWYKAEELSLSSASTFTDLRVALLDACATRPSGEVSDCASAAEAVGIWSPDLIEPIDINAYTSEFGERPLPSDAGDGAALGDRPGASYAFYYRPPATAGGAGDLMSQRRSCTLLEDCPWEPPIVWRRAIVGPDRIVPHTPVVVRHPIPTGGDQLWVCYRDAGGISCDFIDDAGVHRGPILSGHSVSGDISAAILNGTLFVAFTNSRRELMLISHVIGGEGRFGEPRTIMDGGAPVLVSAAPVLGSGLINDAGTHVLLVAFIPPDTDNVVVERINVVTASLVGGWLPTDDDEVVYTPRRPAMALFHQRVHVAMTDVRDRARDSGSLRAHNTLWIATNIAPPYVSGDPSPLVTQAGFFRPKFAFYEGVGGALHLIHTAPGGRQVMRRFKISR